MAIRKRLLLPEGYSAKQIDSVWYLADPHGAPLTRSADAGTVEIHAWRHVWRKRHEDFNNELAAFRAGARLPAICGRYESWGPPHGVEAARSMPVARLGRVRSIRWQVIAAAAGSAAGLVLGFAGMGPLRESLAPLPSPNQRTATIPAAPKSLEATFEHAGVAQASPAVPVRRQPKARYAVNVGSYADPSAADRMKHLVRSKGYIVDVVRRGAVSQVETPPYPTRVQAERVARGFEEIRLPAHLVARRAM
jgi:hypothetical protein